ncbi:MAG: hypothetical protein QNJ60_14905 [Xenococcaceae cyanobacterium MO_188.B19]|nr:hypothetical protein [Xenococcaceae cyanobacterium MO_188.B19]
MEPKWCLKFRVRIEGQLETVSFSDRDELKKPQTFQVPDLASHYAALPNLEDRRGGINPKRD